MGTNDLRRASVLMAVGTITSRVLGFLRAIVLAAAIGLVGSTGANMFSIANQLPNTIYAIVAGGVLSAIFVPQIVRASAAEDGGASYVNKLLTVCIVGLAATTIVATVAAPVLTALYGTRLDPAALKLATGFAYWCLPQIFFYGLYTIFGEVLNARKVFGPYTWAPALNNVVGLAGLAVFMGVYGGMTGVGREPQDWSGGMIALLAGTTTLGVVAQAGILVAFFRRAHIRFRFDWRWRGHGLGTAGRLAGWTFGMLLLTTLAGIVETNVAGIASNSGAASIAALANAWLVFMLPHSVIAVSIATAYFTRMSEHASRSDVDALRNDMTSAARSIGLLIWLATLVIAVCAPFIGAVFMPGQHAEIVAFGAIVIAYIAGLLPFSLLFLVQRTFYTLGDTRTPFFYTLAQVVLICLGSLAVAKLPAEQIAAGIALLVTGSGVMQLVLAAALLRRRIGRLDGRLLSASFLRFAIAGVPTIALGAFTIQAIDALDSSVNLGFESRFGALVGMAAVGVVMAATYFGTLALLRAPELRGVSRFMRVGRSDGNSRDLD
ncbi:MAG TPA: murein biosynthesis integral membrane protein MurJ [Microbacteriaceae bacterium]|nr:murein biosynthesis integral membrane protein MurJ [Microbacteriaceae bacterium]